LQRFFLWIDPVVWSASAISGRRTITNRQGSDTVKRKPDFRQLLKVLEREKPDRPTLFEYYMNQQVYNQLTADLRSDPQDDLASYKKLIDAFARAGYDYVTLTLPGFSFALDERHTERTVSLNTGQMIVDRDSFNRYPWPDPLQARFDLLDRLANYLPAGMKFITPQPVSILGGTINLLGYDNLCLLLYDDESLVSDVFGHVAERITAFHRQTMKHPAVGACLINDDWGFNQQTRISPDHLRRHVFPWYRQIVHEIHAAGKPAILHSCGNLETVMPDIIDILLFDGKHSFQDQIMPIEQVYQLYSSRIAILGGIDVDFMCRQTPEAIYRRSRNMLQLSERKGSYALGTGNSVPEYLPTEHYFAMLRAADPDSSN
jgi:uroporphyrinogen decarboxylase